MLFNPLSIILLFTMITSISASGHLRLVITPSNNLALRIVANILHAESYWMYTGVEKITSFRPLVGQEYLQLSFSVDGMTPQFEDYEFKKAGKTKRSVFEFDRKVILVEATFVCDSGFTGSRCQRAIGSASRRRISTTSITNIPNTATTTIPSATIPTPSALLLQGNSDAIYVLALTIIILAFLIVVLALCIINKRRPSIHIESSITCETLEIRTTDESLNSGQSDVTTRYTKEPHHNSVLMTLC